MNAPFSHVTELTLAGPFLSATEVQEACRNALASGGYGLCLPGSRVEQAYHCIEDADLKLTCRVGFPDGQSDADVQRFEVETAVDAGAHEFEIALNQARLREQNHTHLLRALRDIAEAADERIVKVFIDWNLLTENEIREACRIVLDSGCQFLSLPSLPNPAETTRRTSELRQLIGPEFGLKIHLSPTALAQANAVIEAGATRLGTPFSLTA
jgi:deoxyribose-phosphate aldolase